MKISEQAVRNPPHRAEKALKRELADPGQTNNQGVQTMESHDDNRWLDAIDSTLYTNAVKS